jgi:hypothetical protein
MCTRDRPALARQIGLLSVVVGRLEQMILIVTRSQHPSTTHIPHRTRVLEYHIMVDLARAYDFVLSIHMDPMAVM